jgi:hypothetical protein
MKMGTAQKQNISVQHRMWNRYDSRPKQAIPEFSEWFLNGIRTFEAKGAEFELLQGMVKIQWPGKVTTLRTVSDFKREYESCYPNHGTTA